MKKETMNFVKNSSIPLIGFFFLLAIALPSNAVINCNVTFPSYLTTKSIINISTNITEGAESYNMSAAIFIGKSSRTSNSSFTLLANATNSSGGRFINISFPTIGEFILEDSNDYRAFATCYENSTLEFGDAISAVNSTITTGITVDRTVPSAASSISPSGTTSNKNQEFSGSVNGVNTTSCTLNFAGKNPGNAVYPMIHSANSCTLTLNNIPESKYAYFIRASDGTNSTDSSLGELTISIPTSSSKRAAAAAIAAGGSSAASSPEKIRETLAIAKSGQMPASSGNVELQVSQFIETETQTPELIKTGSGAAIGAVAGTFVVPGIGTGIGALIGGIVGLII